MTKAIDNLDKKMKSSIPHKMDGRPFCEGCDFLLIDGNFGLDIDIPQKSIIAGDQKVMSIAMA